MSAGAHRAAFAHFEAGRFAEASASYSEITKRHPRDAKAWQFLGLSEARRKHFENAVRFQERAIALSPATAEYHHNIGSTYRVVGRFEDSERAYRRALEIRPDYEEAYFNLSSCRRFAEGDEADLEAIKSLWDRPQLSQSGRDFLGFAGGKISDDLGRYDDAFAYFAEGNRARRQVFDRDEYVQYLRGIRKGFSEEFVRAKVPLGLADRRPVFVVGMPRSGTTLVEQILSAHPLVTAAGELPDISNIMATLGQHVAGGGKYPGCVPHLPENVLPGFGGAYLKTRAVGIPAGGRLVDKMPSNYLHLGAIALMFPEASIIHCRRHPLDTCLSCYFQRFRVGHEYSADLGDLGFVYRCYEETMDHWKAVLPRAPFELGFAELIDDQVAVTRRLIEYVGLPWDDACLHFHKVDRPVTTASNWQVRRPLNRRGIGRWRNYERHLGPLREALEDR